jgi:hypothetical protein
MVTLCDTPRDMQIEVLVLALVLTDDVFDDVCPLTIAVRIRQFDAIQTVLQAAQMFGQAERPAVVDRDDFIHAIAEDEPSIQHRHAGLFDRHVVSIEIDGHGVSLGPVFMDEQHDAIPAAREHIGGCHVLQRVDREFGIGFAVQCQFHYAYSYAAIDGCDDGLMGF